MRPLRSLAARFRVTWALWLSLCLIPMAFLLVVQVLWDAAKNAYALWHWQYKYDFKQFFSFYSEKHRKSLHSLAMKPEAGAPVAAFRAVHVRHSEDLQ